MCNIMPTRWHLVTAQAVRGWDFSGQHARKATGSGICTDTGKGSDWLGDQDAIGWVLPARRPRWSTNSSISACRSTAMQTAPSTQRPFGEPSTRFWRETVERACAVADRAGHALLHTLYQRNVRAQTQFFVEWMALDLVRDADGDLLGVVALEMETAISSGCCRQRPRSSPRAARAHFCRVDECLLSIPAMAWA